MADVPIAHGHTFQGFLGAVQATGSEFCTLSRGFLEHSSKLESTA